MPEIRQRNTWRISILMLCILLLAVALSSCDTSDISSQKNGQSTTFTSSTTQQQITYDSSSTDVLIRTFYGGGLQGTLNLSPQISIYGDGTYIMGLDRQGKLDVGTLQQLLNTLVDSYGLLSFKRQQFFDIPDQDATFLELSVNGRHQELMYGAFGSQAESSQDKDEYQRLGKALKAITDALTGTLSSYQGENFVLLARQTFSIDQNQTIPIWPLKDFTLAQVAAFECGIVPPDPNSTNPETACLKFSIPSHAVLLTSTEIRDIKAQLNGRSQGDLFEQGQYYSVTLRPLLPDERVNKMLAMFGSAQSKFVGVPLLEGTVPPLPTATPST